MIGRCFVGCVSLVCRGQLATTNTRQKTSPGGSTLNNNNNHQRPQCNLTFSSTLLAARAADGQTVGLKIGEGQTADTVGGGEWRSEGARALRGQSVLAVEKELEVAHKDPEKGQPA